LQLGQGIRRQRPIAARGGIAAAAQSCGSAM
jgi:hypothetical protein